MLYTEQVEVINRLLLWCGQVFQDSRQTGEQLRILTRQVRKQLAHYM
jgi:hypothetical protein